MVTLPKSGKDPKFPQNLHLVSLLSATSKLLEQVILKIVQRLIEGDLLNASEFGLQMHRSTALQSMRLVDHVTINFNNCVSMAVLFLVIKAAFDIT
jgi:hypothetical protein